MTTDKDFREDYKTKEGAWLAFAGCASNKVIARARTAKELAKMLGKDSISYILLSVRQSEKTKYCYFETDEEADEYVRLGLHCTRGILHVPTGNRWDAPADAAKWLGVPIHAITSMANKNSESAVKNFRYETGAPVIKDNSLRLVCIIKHGTRMYKDVWQTMPNGEYEKYKDAPSYEEFMRTEQKNKKKKIVTDAELKRQHLSIPIKLIDNSDYLATREIGETGTLISRYCGGMHPYKVRFEDSSIMYARPDQVEVMG
jgi:tRNA nucleotidyltransferase/poly(A) polymerase